MWNESAKDLMGFFDLLWNPNLEIEIKAKNRGSKGPAKKILSKTYRRRKGVKPVPVKDSIGRFEREAEGGAARARVGPRLIDRSLK